jgi:hypothetical protein
METVAELKIYIVDAENETEARGMAERGNTVAEWATGKSEVHDRNILNIKKEY